MTFRTPSKKDLSLKIVKKRCISVCLLATLINIDFADGQNLEEVILSLGEFVLKFVNWEGEMRRRACLEAYLGFVWFWLQSHIF